jgi:hypothetical protein
MQVTGTVGTMTTRNPVAISRHHPVQLSPQRLRERDMQDRHPRIEAGETTRQITQGIGAGVSLTIASGDPHFPHQLFMGQVGKVP